jgi:hypothetical protein
MDVRRPFLGLGAVALGWAAVWAAAGLVVLLIASIVDPAVIDPGEGPVDTVPIVAVTGLVSGLVFGLLVAVTERGPDPAAVPLPRAVALGVVAGATLPALSISDAHLSNTIALGVIAALASVAFARALRPRKRARA